MHGRVKVRTSEEQAEAKKREQQEKLKVYSAVTTKIFSKKKNDELDEEMLELTGGVLEKNPDFYTFWNYRRETLLRLKPEKDVGALNKLSLIELDLTQHCLKVNPKSYSAWHHRFWTMNDLHPEADWKRELKLCNYFLSLDERNFHCWDYRREVTKKCQVSPDEELHYTTKLIETNFSNYSAWHYRSKLLPQIHFDSAKGSITENVLLKEFELIQNAAFTDPNDQSVWFYHRWLLGKNKIPLQILNLSILKSQHMIAVLFSEPIQVTRENLKLDINDVPTITKWKSAIQDATASTLWLTDLSNDVGSGDGLSKIRVSLVTEDITDTLSCDVDGVNSFVWKNPNRKDLFRSTLSAATKELLERELESCQQLNELEPDCKWTVFTCVLLMRALDDGRFNSQIEQFMNKLTEIDSSRKNYYRDLGSKFTIENTIEALAVDATQVNLSNRSLTSLHHFDQFLLIEHIDVSSNHLASISPFQYLVCLKSAILDDNQLSDLRAVRGLRSLKSLSVKNNLMKDLEILEDLKTCDNLQELHLQGNPILSEEVYSSTNRCIYSFQIMDGFNL